MEESGAPPFWPWVQIVRTYLATQTLDVMHGDGPGRGNIAQAIPR